MRFRALMTNLLVYPGLGHILSLGRKTKGVFYSLIFSIVAALFVAQAYSVVLSIMKSPEMIQQIQNLQKRPDTSQFEKLVNTTKTLLTADSEIQNLLYLLLFFYFLPSLELILFWRSYIEKPSPPIDSINSNPQAVKE